MLPLGRVPWVGVRAEQGAGRHSAEGHCAKVPPGNRQRDRLSQPRAHRRNGLRHYAARRLAPHKRPPMATARAAAPNLLTISTGPDVQSRVLWCTMLCGMEGRTVGQVLHGSATTTQAIRRAIQLNQESARGLAKRYGVNPNTIAKWKQGGSVSDRSTGPKQPHSTTRSAEDGRHRRVWRHMLLPPTAVGPRAYPAAPHTLVAAFDQQAVLMLHKTRDLLIKQRTMLINALRSHLSEHGVVAAQGPAGMQSASPPCTSCRINGPTWRGPLCTAWSTSYETFVCRSKNSKIASMPGKARLRRQAVRLKTSLLIRTWPDG